MHHELFGRPFKNALPLAQVTATRLALIDIQTSVLQLVEWQRSRERSTFYGALFTRSNTFSKTGRARGVNRPFVFIDYRKDKFL